MKKILYLLLLPCFYGCSENKFSNANYVLSIDTIFFGKINYSDTLSKVIYLKNYSTSEIKILAIENACGCTSGKIHDSLVKVNDSVAINISFMPAVSRDTGSVIKYMTIRTSANPPFRNVIIKAEVKK